MGSICSGSTNAAVSEDTSKAEQQILRQKLTVYGDMFDADTRTIVTLLRMGAVQFSFYNIDTF